MTASPKAALADDMRGQRGSAIGGRLRRLSERIDREAAKLYAEAGVAFEQRWLGVMDLLINGGPQSVVDLARRLGISHVSVSQTRQSLEKAGLIAQKPDPSDGRRRILAMTDKGLALAEQLKPIWAALDLVGQELNAEAGDTVSALDRLDDALARQSLYERAKAKLG